MCDTSPHGIGSTYLLPLLHLSRTDRLTHLTTPILRTHALRPISNDRVSLRLHYDCAPSRNSAHVRHILTSNANTHVIADRSSIYLVRFRIPTDRSFGLTRGRVSRVLGHTRMHPLTINMRGSHRLLRFYCASRITSDTLGVLSRTKLPNRLHLHRKLTLITVINTNIAHGPLRYRHF